MAQTIKLRRSAIQGALPTLAQLDLGEVAINTYDGKLYIKKNDGTESIVQVNPLSTSDLPEGSNQYFTTGRVAAAIASNLSTGYVDLSPTGDAPAHTEGRIFYDNANGALAVYNHEADITLQVGQEEYIRVFNNTGSTILNASPVYITGESSGVPTVALANANSEYSAYAVGLATHDIENNSEGYVTVRGIVNDIDTSLLTAGSRIHVGPGDGVLQTAAPTYPYFTTDIGVCLISGVSGGCIYVDVQNHTIETLRVSNDARIDNNLTVAGDLIVLGNQSTVSVSNLTVDNSFIYSNSGDSIGAASTVFDGIGLDDAYFTGHYTGTATQTFYVKIDGVGTGTGGVDTFAWSFNNFTTTEASGLDITGASQLIANNISIRFNATTGHTLDDVWSGTASPLNVDVGFSSNRNTGTSGVGYTHVGLFFDTTDETWKLFSEYDPEPEGLIDVNDPSFTLAPLKVGSVIADSFTGNVTGNVTGNLTGNVTGTVSSLSNFTTTNLTEGTNKYYTDARVQNVVTKSYVNSLAVDYSSLTGAPDSLQDLTNDMWEVTSTLPTDGSGKPTGYVWYIV